MQHGFRHAICNEVFLGWTFAATCQAIRQAGYDGIEIAPFTLAENPAAIAPGQRREYRDTIASEGLQFAGLHWLMASPAGLHVTTGDAEVRERSWRHVRDLIDLCGDLGEGGVMVFGSPKQRGTTGGVTRAEATRNFTEGVCAVAPHALERGVTILIEALAPAQCDVIASLDEAAALVREIHHPAVATMFDVHNAIDEPEDHAALIQRHYDAIRHIHVNEMDGRHAGTGQYDFQPVLRTLRRRGYAGWISLEVFDFAAGAQRIAEDSLHYLQSEIARLSE